MTNPKLPLVFGGLKSSKTLSCFLLLKIPQNKSFCRSYRCLEWFEKLKRWASKQGRNYTRILKKKKTNGIENFHLFTLALQKIGNAIEILSYF